ncbi:MAG: DUF4091 domain-containing protein [Spirochaetales bacterium]|nr:DUF4091 domain-containing protein [Spirochaetales bacterium]
MKKARRPRSRLHVSLVCLVLLTGAMTGASARNEDRGPLLRLYSVSDRNFDFPVCISKTVEINTLKGYCEYFILETAPDKQKIMLSLSMQDLDVRLYRVLNARAGRKAVPDVLQPVSGKDFFVSEERNMYLVCFTPLVSDAEAHAAIGIRTEDRREEINFRFRTGSVSFSDIFSSLPRNAFSVYVPAFLKGKPAAETEKAYRNICEGIINDLYFSPKYPPELFWEDDQYRDTYLARVNSVSVKKEFADRLSEDRDPYYYRIIDEPKNRNDLGGIRTAREYYTSRGFFGKQLVAFNRSLVSFTNIFSAVRGDVDIWCMNLRLLNNAGVCRNLDLLRSEGKEIWIYVCCDDGHDMNVLLTSGLIESRAIFWYMWLNDIDGFLYWSINRWRDRDVMNDPRTDTNRKRYGDGILVYPDPGNDFSFLPSLRAVNMKTGMMEYAVFSSLDARSRSELAQTAKKLVASPRKVSDNCLEYDMLVNRAKALLNE